MPRPSASRPVSREQQRRLDAALARSARKQQPAAADEPAMYSAVPAIPGTAILPLRLFLGITFVYAAWQKVTDPGFFNPTGGTYIGKQILGFSRGSPISWFLHHAAEHAVAVGVLTVITELAIGLLVLLGLFVRPAALAGLCLNMGFFLSASWHTYPYFMGSDIVFVMCWLTLILTGPGPFALDAVVRAPLAQRVRSYGSAPLAAAVQRVLNGPLPQPQTEPLEAGDGQTSRLSPQLLVTRAEVLAGAVGALALIVLGLFPRGGSSGGRSNVALPPAKPAGHGPSGSTGGGQASGGGKPANVPAGAKKIGNISQLPANSAGVVTDPKSGDPAIVIHTSGSNYYAYDAVCTHAGCTVEYDPQSKLIVCPCHGAEYDPTQDAQVVGGPAPAPLSKLPMTIDARGNIWLA